MNVTTIQNAWHLDEKTKWAVIAYRAANPKSRAMGPWTYYGSGSKRKKATCIFCRQVVATCSAEWPETKEFRKNADEHAKECAEKFLKKLRDFAKMFSDF